MFKGHITKKIRRHIRVPILLSIDDFYDPEKKKKDAKYQSSVYILKAICFHHGEEMISGHYTG